MLIERSACLKSSIGKISLCFREY
ncbi:hypothetical protein THICB6_40129 [Thiomonas arsenitoxydans]|nr:hypothetical protein THICB6_40129 [Thiomonas arsenitoxydans]